PQISIRIPQTMSPLPVRAADIELVIRTSSLNHRRQSSSSLASRFYLPPAFGRSACLDVGWRTKTLLRRVIVVLSGVLEHKPQAALGLLIAAVGVGAYWFWHRPVTKRTATAETSNVAAEKTATGLGVAISEKSIAVLPFENLSSDKENAYFAEGIQDEILTRL